MNKIVLHTEAETLSTPQGGMATANIWLEINGRSFPAEQWNDSVLVVLNWWSHALLRLTSGASANACETVYFMEGPYAVEVAISAAGVLRFRAIDRAARANEVASGEEKAEQFILGLISQSREILDSCKRREWWSKDAEALELSLEALSKAR